MMVVFRHILTEHAVLVVGVLALVFGVIIALTCFALQVRHPALERGGRPALRDTFGVFGGTIELSYVLLRRVQVEDWVTQGQPSPARSISSNTAILSLELGEI